MVKAIIYDVDGVIVDSEPLHIKAWIKTVEKFGSFMDKLPTDFLQQRKGERPINIAQEFVEKLSLSVAPNSFLDTKVAFYGELMHTNLQLLPGVKESLAFFQKENMLFGIGTSDVRKDTEYLLQKFDLGKYFSVIVTGDEVSKGKPNPEIYEKVIAQLALQPEECIVIEDATRGVLAARSAGCFCIGITNNTREQDLSQANVIINTLEDINQRLCNTIAKK